MNKQRILILGAGEQGKVAENIFRINGYVNIAFLDDRRNGQHTVGKLRSYKKYNDRKTAFFVSFGNNTLREKWYLSLKRNKCMFINAIHPSSIIEYGVHLGENIMIGALTYININSSIGNNTILNNGCIIEHDNTIEEHVHVGPGVMTAGGVTIKQKSFVGMGSRIIDDLTIAEHCIIGAGSIIIRSTRKNGLYVGSPADRKKTIPR